MKYSSDYAAYVADIRYLHNKIPDGAKPKWRGSTELMSWLTTKYNIYKELPITSEGYKLVEYSVESDESENTISKFDYFYKTHRYNFSPLVNKLEM